ncbi:FadR/GntR family transcriptional regulator [Nakamurella alba]|uniref:FadR/GntR family transcriptional regulator n=1 Tax=Nakamurella alba TaxID=2665158 RepID=UPI0012B8E07C|nr:FCD domain-containing protein [Nakamurella alba]
MAGRVERAPSRGELSAHTARRILRDVTERGLRVGESLGDESWLIEHYDVSRGTLREALKLLSFLGAITVKSGPRGGPQLTTPGSAVVGSALGMVVQFRGATLHTVFQARAAIEPAVAALAASCRNETDLRVLDRQVDLLRAAQSTHGPVYAGHSERFNLLLAEASHNEVLATTVPAMAAMTAAVTWRYGPGMRPELTERIGRVVAAVRDSDPAAATAEHAAMFGWLIDELLESQPARMQARILWPDVDEILADQRYG